MSLKYAKILYSRNSGPTDPSLNLREYMKAKNKVVANTKSDSVFYENLILFTAKVLQGAFEKSDIPKLEVELNRLFRTNAFNISQRRQNKEDRFKKYPALREPPLKETNDAKVERLLRRMRIPKENQRVNRTKDKNDIKPL